MTRGTARLIALAISASSAAAARADEPILLATMNAGVTVGTPHSYDWHWPTLAYLLSPSPADNVVLFEDVVLPPVYPVTISDTISYQDDLDFEPFASLLTDGVNQDIVTVAWGENGGVAGGGGPESQRLRLLVPAFGPDLIGYTIDHIARQLTVDIESPGLDPFGTGIWTDWTVTGTYEFYGTPVPEPATASLVLIAAAAILPRIKRM